MYTTTHSSYNMSMTKKNPNAFASALIARFLCERRPMPGVSGTTGYLYHVPIILKDFIQYVTEDPIPQQNHCKVATGVGNRALLLFHLPSHLWGFTEDLSGYLEGPQMSPCKESQFYDRGAFTRVKGVVRLKHDFQFAADSYVVRKTESQLWIESLGFETLAEMIVAHRHEFDEWIKMVVLTRARCKPVSSKEMTLIESLLGVGTWQRVIPVRVTE